MICFMVKFTTQSISSGMNKNKKCFLKSYKKCSVFVSISWNSRKPFKSKQNREHREKSAWRQALLPLCSWCVRVRSSRSRSTRREALSSFARCVMLLYASSVTLAIVRTETGTGMYREAELLSAVPVEAKLCRLWAETQTPTRLGKKKSMTYDYRYFPYPFLLPAITQTSTQHWV